MRRHGGLWERVVSKENLALAWKKAARGKAGKGSVRRFAERLEENLEEVRQMMIAGKFRTSPYTARTIYEPKKREIYALPFAPDRIVQHALMNVVAPVWEGLFIADSYACRPGKGIHAASCRTMEFVRRNKYCLKCDISKFYPSIDQYTLFGIVKQKIKDRRLLGMLGEIITSFRDGEPGLGIPIGNYTSQWFGNLYLNELDRIVVQGTFGYVRYCDDFCVFSNNKDVLSWFRDNLSFFLIHDLGLRLSRADLFPVKQGVDFVGYRHFPDKILLRKSAAARLKRRVRALPGLLAAGKISPERYRSSLASAWGWLAHGNCRHLAESLGLERLLAEAGRMGRAV